MSVHFVSCSIDLGETTFSRAPSVLKALEFLEASFLGEFQEYWFRDLRVDQVSHVLHEHELNSLNERYNYTS